MRNSVIALSLVLTACAAPGGNGYWMNAANDSTTFERDKAQCIYESKMATANAPASFSLSQNISQDIATGVRQGELQRMCLEAKGYYWVPR